jgi:hypothetical protein
MKNGKNSNLLPESQVLEMAMARGAMEKMAVDFGQEEG